MHNKHRGEVTAKLDGQTYRLCLSLGALAELESAFGEDDMIALACRFETGRLKAADAIRVIGAGLRGAGHEISDETVAAMRSDEGAGGYVAIVVRLLEATFGSGERQDGAGKAASNKDASNKTDPSKAVPNKAVLNKAVLEGEGRAVPFPGTT